MEESRISVIIPTYNRANLIRRAIGSALDQLIPGDEIIVVDDGSTDNTNEVVDCYRDRVKYIRIQNRGAGVARNCGIQEARHDLIAFLDSDDEWMKDKLPLQRILMQAHPDIVFCFSDFAITDSAGQPQHRFLKNWHQDPRRWEEILGPGQLYSVVGALPPDQPDFSFHIGDLYDSEMAANYVFTSTLIVRRSLAGSALHFGEGIPTYEDWECYGRLARQGLGAYMDCETAWQHGHRGGRLTDADAGTSATARIAVLERVWGSDADYQRRKGEEYRRMLSGQRLIKAASLIMHGRTKEARFELCEVKDAPLTYRVMAVLPGPVAIGLYDLRRILTGQKRAH